MVRRQRLARVYRLRMVAAVIRQLQLQLELAPQQATQSYTVLSRRLEGAPQAMAQLLEGVLVPNIPLTQLLPQVAAWQQLASQAPPAWLATMVWG